MKRSVLRLVLAVMLIACILLALTWLVWEPAGDLSVYEDELPQEAPVGDPGIYESVPVESMTKGDADGQDERLPKGNQGASER